MIGGKWKALILFWLRDRVCRFGDLRRKIPGISERMLTRQLRELEDDGIVHRKVYPVVPPKVEYSLTAYGRTLRPITDLMCKWARRTCGGRKEARADATAATRPNRLECVDET